MSIWLILKSSKESYLAKTNFYSSLTDRKTSGKNYELVLNVWKKI